MPLYDVKFQIAVSQSKRVSKLSNIISEEVLAENPVLAKIRIEHKYRVSASMNVKIVSVQRKGMDTLTIN